MFAWRTGTAVDGMLSDQKVTLCGWPDTTVQRTPSPRLIVREAGSNRYPPASPSIFTSHVFPVIGCAAAFVVAAVDPGAAAGGAAWVVAPLAPGCDFSP